MKPTHKQSTEILITIITIAISFIILVAGVVIKLHITQHFLPSDDHNNSSTTDGNDNNTTDQDPNTTPSLPSVIPNPAPSDPQPSSAFLNLQPTLDQWISSLSSSERAGVMIYDLDHHRVAAEYNANQVFNVASIYKLLFVYDGYQQIALGKDQPDQFFTRTSDKGRLTLSACLDLTIRESYNGCADVLASNPARQSRVTKLIQNLSMSRTSNHGLESTATDLTKLLYQYWQHDDLTPELWDLLADSMLNQPPTAIDSETTYDWRQGLPAGFSNQVKVYDKVGWDWDETHWNIYADAAILDFTNLDRHYTAVVLTADFPSTTKITQLGRAIEAAVIAESKAS